MSIITMTDLDLGRKRVLIREDFNLPVSSGKVTCEGRILAALPTLKIALNQGARVMVMSHFGKPKEGRFSQENTLQPVASHLSEILGFDVPVIRNYLSNKVDLEEGKLVLLENVLFNHGESENAVELAKEYAALCDVFVMDAFGVAHRGQASTHGVCKFARVACAGPLLNGELSALTKVLETPDRPMVAIVSGSNISTKLEVINSLTETCDQLIVGGGIANTFLAARGKKIGVSLSETELVDTAAEIANKVEIPMVKDVVVAKEFSALAPLVIKNADKVADDEMIMDIGPTTATYFASLLRSAKTILWNGPVGVFEFDQFSQGTRILAEAIAESSAFSVAGGDATLAAIGKFGVREHISHVSMGGDAFIDFIQGKTLPTIAVLQERANNRNSIKGN